MSKDYIFIQKKEGIHLLPNAYVIARVYTHSLKKILNGKSFGPTLVLYQDGVMFWHASERALKQSSAAAFAWAKRDPKLVEKMVTKFNQTLPPLKKLMAKISSAKLKRASSKDLWCLLEEYLKLYETSYLHSEPLVITLNDVLADYLKKYLRTRITTGDNISDIYNQLISPTVRSFVKREDDELLALAKKTQQGSVKNLSVAIKSHTKKYGWIPYDYGMYTWDEKYFREILEKILSERNIVADVEKSKKYFRELPKRQAQLEKDLKIDTYHRQLFACMRQAAYLLDYKKEIFTKVHFISSALLTEIAHRLGTTKELVQYYLPEEIKAALTKGAVISSGDLRNRSNYSIYYFYGERVKLTTGQAAKTFLASHLKTIAPPISVLTGVIASSGTYTGRIKVLTSAAQMSKVHQGDILVTAMTSPEYVPAMKKAGAIITDEGGVMCHAAIVSRELGIPCVVGTRNATKVLHDGDIVEVNANHNSVKIIKK